MRGLLGIRGNAGPTKSQCRTAEIVAFLKAQYRAGGSSSGGGGRLSSTRLPSTRLSSRLASTRLSSTRRVECLLPSLPPPLPPSRLPPPLPTAPLRPALALRDVLQLLVGLPTPPQYNYSL